jgi:hypothetical protein
MFDGHPELFLEAYVSTIYSRCHQSEKRNYLFDSLQPNNGESRFLCKTFCLQQLVSVQLLLIGRL